MIKYPFIALTITLVLCLLWMRAINYLAAKKIVSSNVSRKLIHIGTGPIFVACWLLFPEQGISRYLAAAVPLLIVLQVLVVGLGLLKDYTSVQSMARTGKKNELLKGPLFYGIVFVLVTQFFWKQIHAVIALMILCGGDGAADLVGSRIKSPALPWAKKKTVVGSIAMFLGGALLSLLMLLIVFQPSTIGLQETKVGTIVFLISFAATLVESITPSDYDNITVPAVSLLLSISLL